MSNLGYPFEIEEVDYWRKIFPGYPDSTIYRVEGSGRSKNATKTGGQDTVLDGDVWMGVSPITGLPKNILTECKHYKSNRVQKSFSILKKWVDQARHEAEQRNCWSAVAIKYKGVFPNSLELREYCWADGKDGNSVHYVIPRAHLTEILTHLEKKRLANTVDLSTVDTQELLAELSKRMNK